MANEKGWLEMQVNIALTFDIHFAQSVEKCVKELEVVGCGNVAT